MGRVTSLFVCLLFALALVASPLPVFAQDDGDEGANDAQWADLWTDFNHYVRIARPDQAVAAGRTLLDQVDQDTLLRIVENSEYSDYQRTLDVAARNDTVADIAKAIGDRIQTARIARARDGERIAADIAKLAEGTNPRFHALQRLRAAGEYAAPALLDTLLDEDKSSLHPYVLAAIVSIGRPLVYPLSVALGELPPVQQGQIANALAEIGYPRALPYIKQVIEDESTDAKSRETCQAAFNELAERARVPGDIGAAELFRTLARNHYSVATDGDIHIGVDPTSNTGLVWTYNKSTQLRATAVPARIYGDVLARIAAERTLALDNADEEALSLWLMANLRRENRLQDGEDPSYPSRLREATYYAKLAGSLRLHDVLKQALDDRDPVLALDAISVLADIGGMYELTNVRGAYQPLLRALNYPDRRIRFEAAFALSNARPRVEFTGSHRVVPVLSEAIRQTDLRYAVVIGPQAETKAAVMRNLGYEVYQGAKLSDLVDPIHNSPGIDLIVSTQSADAVEQLNQERTYDYKLATVPIVAVTLNTYSFSRRFVEGDNVYAVLDDADTDALARAINAVSREHLGSAMDADEAHAYAARAMSILYDLAKEGSTLFPVIDAQPALESALTDERTDLVVAAANTLAMMDNDQAQTAVAGLALDAGLHQNDPLLQIAGLDALATSARYLGNRLSPEMTAKILELATDPDPELSEAAARTHGALEPVTDDLVDLILGE